MSKTRYVQHISGQGEKWEVSHEYAQRWDVKPNQDEGPAQILSTWLPKSEYVEVPAPEVWTDVTAACSVVVLGHKQLGVEGHFIVHHRPTLPMERLAKLVCGGNYRVRRITATDCTKDRGDREFSAFIIEQKEQP